MTIRDATVEDVPGIALVATEAWRWAFGPFLAPEFLAERVDVGRRAERMRARWGETGPTRVAVDGSGVVVGFASEHTPPQLEGYDAEIGALYVHPDMARKGVGRALVRDMAGGFVARGDRSMAIHTLAQNAIGCGFYGKLGGRRHVADEWNGYPSVWFVWDDLAALDSR